jgi:hypothetical protein
MNAYLFTRLSNNKKTGKIPVTSAGKLDCSPSCPLLEKGCYAAYSHIGIMWDKLTATKAGQTFKHGRSAVKTVSWGELCSKVAALPAGQLWRHNQMGDLPHNGGRIAKRKLSQLVKANSGKRGFTYTHHNVLQSKYNREAIESANNAGFTVNLSGNNLKHADSLADLNIAPVVSILPESFIGKKSTKTPTGRVVSICPAVNSDAVTCKSCGLCQFQRESIVGFPAHGAARKFAGNL